MPIRSDYHPMQWLENNPDIEIGVKYDDGEMIRVVYQRVGSRNDQEWKVLAEGYSLRDTLYQAMKVHHENN